MTETIRDMVIHQPRCLHKGITDCAADKGETSLFHILRHRIGLHAGGGHVAYRLPIVLQGFSVDKIPQISVQRAALLLQLEKGTRILDEAINLETVTHDTRVLQKRRDFSVVVTHYLVSIEMIEHVAAQVTARIPTGILNRAIRDAEDRVSAPSIRGKRLHIYYAVQTDVKPLKFSLFVNNPKLIVPNYRDYLINSLRQKFGLEGAPIVLIFRNRPKRAR